MSHLNKLSASEQAERYIAIQNLLEGLKSDRKELTQRIKSMSDDLTLIGDDLIEYMSHFKCMIPLRDGRVMELDKAKRRVAKSSEEKRRALEEAMAKTSEVSKSEMVALFSKALASGIDEKPVIIVDDPKKLADKKTRLALKEQKAKEKTKKKSKKDASDDSLDSSDSDPVSTLIGKKK